MKKNRYQIITVPLLVILIIRAALFYKYYYQSQNLRYSQEYIGQQGNIDKESF